MQLIQHTVSLKASLYSSIFTKHQKDNTDGARQVSLGRELHKCGVNTKKALPQAPVSDTVGTPQRGAPSADRRV